MPSVDFSAPTTPLPPATVGPAVVGTSSCPLGEGVVACIVAALVVVIVFLAALAFSVLLLACSQPRREPRRIHAHHRKRHRRSHAAHHRGRGQREEGVCESALRGVHQPERGVCSLMAEHGSSGRSSPDVSTSPYHPRYNSPATSVCCEEFRMPSCTCHGCSNRTPILHSTMCTQFHTAASCHLMSRLRQEAVRTTVPPGGDASDTSRDSDHTVNAGALSDSQSLEWDNFQPSLLATRAWSSVTHLDITDGESLSVAGGSHQEQQRQEELPAQSQQWV